MINKISEREIGVQPEGGRAKQPDTDYYLDLSPKW